MVTVCIHLDNNQSEIQWSFLLSNFRPDEIRLLGEYEPTDKIFRDVKRGLPNKPLIILTPKDGRYMKGDISLSNFTHPEDAVYVFGSDKKHMEPMDGTLVYIPTDSNVEMYSWSAGAVVLWDRRCG